MTRTVTDYLARITPWQSTRQRFVATVAGALAPIADAGETVSGVPAAFDLDAAIGAQLDVVGEWVGRARNVSVPLVGIYFAWDDPLRGWDLGVWKGPYDTPVGVTSLDDETYRRLLRANILAKRWDGTVPGAQAAFDVFFIDPDIHANTGKVGISLKAGSGADIVMTAYVNLCAQDGTGFASALDAKAYLDGEFAKQRSVDIPSITASAGADLTAGMPVCVSRQNGALFPARADIYAQAFVVGLCGAGAAAGFPTSATRNAITLADWSAVTGAAALSVGQPYFLGPSGTLTTIPDLTPGLCLVRVGNTTGRQTFAPVLADPILL